MHIDVMEHQTCVRPDISGFPVELPAIFPRWVANVFVELRKEQAT